MAIPKLIDLAAASRPAFVYGLISPDSNTLFWVGVTTRPLHRRLGSHVHDGKLGTAGPRCDEIRRLAAAGLRPAIFEIERVPHEQWVEAEQFWIAYFRALGAALTNRAIGGPGATGTRQTAATQKLRSMAAQGRDLSLLHSPEMRERAAAKMRGRPGKKHSTETRAKLSAVLKGRPAIVMSEAHQQAFRAGAAANRKRQIGPKAANRRSVIVDGVEYWGLTGAARALGVWISTIQRWIKKGRASYVDGK